MMFFPVATAAQGRGRSVAPGFPGGLPMRHFEVGTTMADLIPIKGARSRHGIKLHRLNALPERPQREEVIESLLAVGEIAALVSPVRLPRTEFRLSRSRPQFLSSLQTKGGRHGPAHHHGG
jgi:hypothetical protein